MVRAGSGGRQRGEAKRKAVGIELADGDREVRERWSPVAEHDGAAAGAVADMLMGPEND